MNKKKYIFDFLILLLTRKKIKKYEARKYAS